MRGGISVIVNDAAIKTNLIQAAVLFTLQPLLKRAEKPSNYTAVSFNVPTPLSKRIAELEARQTLVESELTLLRGELDRERVGA